MCPFSKREEIQQFCYVVAPALGNQLVLGQVQRAESYLTLESPLSSLKLALIAALSFCTTARSSAIVLEARTFRINCFTRNGQRGSRGGADAIQELMLAV
jgi:hypothetical protein